MNNAVFGKTIENVRKPRDIKLVTTETRRDYFVSDPNYHTTTFFTENLLAIQMKKYLRINLSIKEFQYQNWYEFWYNYVRPEEDEKAKMCYMDSYIILQIINQKYHCLKENIKK